MRIAATRTRAGFGIAIFTSRRTSASRWRLAVCFGRAGGFAFARLSAGTAATAAATAFLRRRFARFFRGIRGDQRIQIEYVDLLQRLRDKGRLVFGIRREIELFLARQARSLGLRRALARFRTGRALPAFFTASPAATSAATARTTAVIRARRFSFLARRRRRFVPFLAAEIDRVCAFRQIRFVGQKFQVVGLER